MIPFDKIGREITIDCFIAYGHALGRSAGLRIGRVLAIKEPEGGENNSDFKYCGGGWRITVIGVDDDWNWKEPKLNTRKGVLQFPCRMLVISREDMPERYRELMEGYVP